MQEKDIIVCDLDGTLADIHHRRHHVEKQTDCQRCSGIGLIVGLDRLPCDFCAGTGKLGQKPDWSAFHQACVDDTPLLHTIEIVGTFALVTGRQVWIVSGRSDEVHQQTVAWVEKHVPYARHLIMRKAGDYTPDDVLKKRWLDKGTIPKERVFCVFDDRDRVVEMWRGEGLQCYQVAPGDF